MNDLAHLKAELARLQQRVEELEATPASPPAMSRRHLLRGAAAAAVGGTVAAVGMAGPAAATNGGSVVLGGTRTAESPTQVQWDGGAAATSTAFLVQDGSAFLPANTSAPAVLAGWASNSGPGGFPNGVYGFTDRSGGFGVVGVKNGSAGGAVKAVGNQAVGLLASSTGSSAVVATASNLADGVKSDCSSVGRAAGNFTHASDGYGVIGKASSTQYPGVQGTNFGKAPGVLGTNDKADGVGVQGKASNTGGVGVLATATGPAIALKVQGSARFEAAVNIPNRSGVLTVAGGTSTVAKTGVTLGAGAIVIATLQQDVPGVHVRSVTLEPANSKFVVHLSGNVPAATKVAFLIIN